MMRRWAICDRCADGNPAVAGHTATWRRRAELLDGRILVDAEFDDDSPALDAAQRDPRIVVLPSLSAPASRLPSAMQQMLADAGIVPAHDDTVLNTLRALRNSLGLNFRVDLER